MYFIVILNNKFTLKALYIDISISYRALKDEFV